MNILIIRVSIYICMNRWISLPSVWCKKTEGKAWRVCKTYNEQIGSWNKGHHARYWGYIWTVIFNRQDLPVCTCTLVLEDWWWARHQHWDVASWARLWCQWRPFIRGDPPRYNHSYSPSDRRARWTTTCYNYSRHCYRYVSFLLCQQTCWPSCI